MGSFEGDVVQFGLLHRAIAAANLSSLGWQSQDIKRVVTEWGRRQIAQSLGEVVREVATLKVIDDMGGDCQGKMFLSFHYSVYPIIFRALGRHSPNQTIFSLIGHQTAQHCQALQAIARTSGIQIHFVQSGFRMISEMKAGLKRGHVGLALLDVPWSKAGTLPDRHHAAFGGSFGGLSTLERLVDAIDDQREIVSVSRDGSAVSATRLGNLSYADAFKHLGELIQRDPCDYERLHQFHRFFTFDNPASILVSFRLKGQRYAVLGPSMRIMKISDDDALDEAEMNTHGLCENRRLADLFRENIGGDFEHVLCL